MEVDDDPVETMRMRTDAELLESARSEAGAFRELYDRYADAMFAFHRRRASDADAAYDLTAETFAQAWLSRLAFRDEAGGSAGPWLFGIGRNVLAASVRRGVLETRARERLGLLVAAERPVATATANELEDEPERWGDDLDRAFAALPHGLRSAVRLRVVDEEDYADVAHRLGTTPEAARVRVHRGLSALRTVITDRSEVSQ